MPIATNGIDGPGLDTLRQAAVALLITGRPVRVAVGVAPEEPHVVAYDAGPVVLEPAPVIPVQAGLRRDGVGEGGVSLFVCDDEDQSISRPNLVGFGRREGNVRRRKE